MRERSLICISKFRGDNGHLGFNQLVVRFGMQSRKGATSIPFMLQSLTLKGRHMLALESFALQVRDSPRRSLYLERCLRTAHRSATTSCSSIRRQ